MGNESDNYRYARCVYTSTSFPSYLWPLISVPLFAKAAQTQRQLCSIRFLKNRDVGYL